MSQTCDVLLCGSGVANLFAALALQQAGVRVLLIQPPGPPPSGTSLGVVWPSLTEHWGILRDNLGAPAVAALMGLFRRSSQLIQPLAGGHGAVLQLACNATEWREQTLHLREIDALWPRRLMSGASANNYLVVGEVDGAAFVPDCCSFDPLHVRQALWERLQPDCRRESIQRVGEGWVETQEGRYEAEVVVVSAGPNSLRWLGISQSRLFPGLGMLLHFPHLQGIWNRALVGVESYRGHLMVAPHPEGGWWLAGMAPEADASPERLQRLLVQLASAILPDLEGQVPQSARILQHTLTADGLPLAGPLPGCSRRWLVAGLGSRSWSWGPALGEQVALSLLGQPSPLLSSLSCLRPSRWL